MDPSRTIVLVDRPYLIDYSRYDVPSMDAPGFITADGRAFPFFTGPVPKIARLRAAGFDTLVVTDPVQDLCFDPNRIRIAIPSRPQFREVYERFLDWGEDIQEIERQAPGTVERHGSLLVIDLVAAQRALTEPMSD